MLRKFVVALVAAVFLAACVTTPETPRERLASAELSYQTAANTVDSLVDSGVLRPGSDAALTVDAAQVAANDALAVWRLNPDDSSAAQAALTALSALRSLLLNLQAQSAAAGPTLNFESYGGAVPGWSI